MPRQRCIQARDICGDLCTFAVLEGEPFHFDECSMDEAVNQGVVDLLSLTFELAPGRRQFTFFHHPAEAEDEE